MKKKPGDKWTEFTARADLDKQWEGLEHLKRLIPDSDELKHNLAAGDARIPIGNAAYRGLMELTRYPVTHHDQVNGATRRFEKMTDAGQLAFSFATVADQVPGAVTFNDTIPAVHVRARETLAAVWYFTKETKARDAEPLEGTATAEELAAIRGLTPKGGRDWERLQTDFLTVATGTFTITTGEGEKIHRFGYPFLSWWETVGTGKNTRYFWGVNPPSISDVTAGWIAGKVDAALASDTGGFVPYPRAYLSDGLDAHIANLRDTLLTFRNWARPVAYLTLAKWAGYSPYYIRKEPGRVREAIEKEWLPTLKKRGYIADFELLNIRGTSGRGGKVGLGRGGLKVKLKPPKKRGKVQLTPEQEKQFAEVMEWLTRTDGDGANVHGIRKAADGIKADVESGIRRNGFAFVWDAYQEHGCGAKPNTRAFFNAISPEHKRTKKATADAPTLTPPGNRCGFTSAKATAAREKARARRQKREREQEERKQREEQERREELQRQARQLADE